MLESSVTVPFCDPLGVENSPDIAAYTAQPICGYKQKLLLAVLL